METKMDKPALEVLIWTWAHLTQGVMGFKEERQRKGGGMFWQGVNKLEGMRCRNAGASCRGREGMGLGELEGVSTSKWNFENELLLQLFFI